MLLKHKTCGYQWNHTPRDPNKKLFFATCPRCLGKVNINKGQVTEENLIVKFPDVVGFAEDEIISKAED